MKFGKPPLIELVAEFRWYPVDLAGQLVTNPNHIGMPSHEVDLFYENFRSIVAKDGFYSSERLIPDGFPHPMHQPVVRYRRPDSSQVLQLGVGLMSVHALPPYENWEAFRPVIEFALRSLIETRNLTVDARKHMLPTMLPSTEDKEFVAISLRYIDSFGAELTANRTGRNFLREVLGLNIDLPQSVSDQVSNTEAIEISLQVKGPLTAGGALQLSFGRNPNDPQSFVMDTVVVCDEKIRWNPTDPMQALEAAHGAIRHLFVGMTKPIHMAMEPMDAEAKSL